MIIFSGYKINRSEYGVLKILAKEFDTIHHSDQPDVYYVGKILVTGYSGSAFHIDQIRKYSVNDLVRNVRFGLMKLDSRYNNVFPQLYFI